MRNNFEEPPNPQLQNQLQNTPAWAFPFHASCWDILQIVRPVLRVDIQNLFNILRSFPVQSGLLNFGHDYGGEALYQTHAGSVAAGEELLLTHGPTSKNQECDPLEIGNMIRSLARKRKNRDQNSKTAMFRGFQSVTTDDPFSTLA